MSSVTWTGLEELKEALRSLPADLAAGASGTVLNAAENAAQGVRTEYARHVVTRDLLNHVTVSTVASGPYGAGAAVKSTARHAWLFEHGTQARHYVTKKNGVRHLTGPMPPTPAFIPAAVRARRKMYEDLRGLLVQHGATTVTGEP